MVLLPDGATEEYVTPYVGVWIEIFCAEEIEVSKYVTPYVGVWIEILHLHTSGL